MNLSDFVIPPRFALLPKNLRRAPIRMLDIGVANDSATLAMRWFPLCEYHGVDITAPAQSELSQMQAFYHADLEHGLPDSIPDNYFDVVIASHVLEHIHNGEEVLKKLTEKLRDGGRIYLEFPSLRSLSFPSGVGCLNFHDDPTHVRTYDVAEIVSLLSESGMRVISAGRRTNWPRIWMFPLCIPLQIKTLLQHKKLHAKGLWDIMGFADLVYAERLQSTPI